MHCWSPAHPHTLHDAPIDRQGSFRYLAAELSRYQPVRPRLAGPTTMLSTLCPHRPPRTWTKHRRLSFNLSPPCVFWSKASSLSGRRCRLLISRRHTSCSHQHQQP
ncbi:hypothetical protein PsYK624_033310 [Phanerochaete sordida]|uniref:Uncharacterized protein n=1 Tax=Phanerochaete sordida TaxID=48140 RepID=A0A9P3G2V1_9APHY|nr:hypothetical protein PsYK624_033310 [Phanerochaete sordida]